MSVACRSMLDGRVRECVPKSSPFSLINRMFYWVSCLHRCLVHPLKPCIVNKSFLPRPASISSKAINGWENYLISYNVEFPFKLLLLLLFVRWKNVVLHGNRVGTAGATVISWTKYQFHKTCLVVQTFDKRLKIFLCAVQEPVKAK